MALKTCEDCKKEISTLAVNCPNCGRPNENAGIVTIEQTKKKWKHWDIFGLVLIVFSLVDILLLIKFGFASKSTLSAALAVLVVGFMIWIASGIGRWYHHG
ncbi:MAG: hypothetical protein WA081_17505 [Desulfosalsimonadaceae bacterium]